MKSNKKYVVYNEDLDVTSISTAPIEIYSQNCKSILDENNTTHINKRLPGDFIDMSDYKKKNFSDLKVALICNWSDQCGIATYSNFLLNSLKKYVKNIHVFSEKPDDKNFKDSDLVTYCWERGRPLDLMCDKLKKWEADFVIIQHEFGIFPNAFYFMKLMEELKNIPYVVAIHSVYKHLDKTVYLDSVKTAIVHSETAKKCLYENGNRINTFVVPHGCIQLEETEELWNICVSPYVIMQFGFGFKYKGVENAIRAISHLIKTDLKFKNLYYIYLCSENKFNKGVHEKYYKEIKQLAKDLNVENNICVIRKYQTDEMLNLYLRLSKLAIFPYIVDKDNLVYGASGAIRIAMANKKPVIASDSTMFDDLSDIVPRPSNYIELAKEIDKIFSDDSYKNEIVSKCQKYILDNSWDNISLKYLEVYNHILENR